jgi:hypothetical protein
MARPRWGGIPTYGSQDAAGHGITETLDNLSGSIAAGYPGTGLPDGRHRTAGSEP